MKQPQPGIRLRRDSRSGRESPRLLAFRARFSFLCWPYEDGGLAALAPLRGAKASAAAAPAPSLAQRRRERQSYQGASGGPDSAANRAAGRADTPRWMPFASQNCPQPYRGESGGLEPAMKPMAGQAGAPLHNLSP